MTEHLPPRQLLGYLDGELSKAATRAADEHLHSCWTCRTELERLQKDIGAIVEAQNDVLLRGVSPPPKAWPRIEPLLAAAAEPDHVTWRTRLSQSFTVKLRWSPASATAVIVAVAGLIGVLSLTPSSVSANEVLRQVSQSDAKRMATAGGRIVHQRVRVAKTERRTARTTFGEIDSWRGANNSVYWRVDASDLAASDLQRRHERESLPAELPLSADAYRSWSRQLSAEPRAYRHGDVMDISFTVVQPSDAGQPAQIDLQIRRGEWRVIAMNLNFADAGFEIGGEEFAVISRSDTPPDVLAHLEPPSPKTEEVSIASPSRVPAPPDEPAAPPLPNIDDIEMGVWLTLHRIGADMGEPVAAARDDSGMVRVSAWGATQERKNQLRELFRDQPHVHLELEAPASRSGMVTELSLAPASTLTDPDERLTRWFGGSGQRENFTRSVLETSTSMLSHLYALQELAQRWTPDSVRGLTSSARNNLESMIDDHARAAAADESKLKVMLGPLVAAFGAPTDAGNSRAPEDDWRASTVASLRTAKDVAGLLRSFLTTTNQPVAPEEALSQIQRKLAELDGSLLLLRSSKL